MSSALSIDDLVSSFKGNHIGDEALKLQALQAQLSESLFHHPIHPNGYQIPSRQTSSDCGQPCNTPTMRTPSTSFSFGHVVPDLHQPHSTPRPSPAMNHGRADSFGYMLDEDMDDEAMVEDILMPSTSPLATSPTASSYSSTVPFPSKPIISTTSSSSAASYSQPMTPSESSSMFTSSDPFYLQLAQAQNRPATSTSVFAQAGAPCQQSPFMLGQPFQMSTSVPHTRRDSFGHGHYNGYNSMGPAVASATPQPLMASAFDG